MPEVCQGQQHRRPQEHVREPIGVDEADPSFLSVLGICLFPMFLLLMYKILFQVFLKLFKNKFSRRVFIYCNSFGVFPEVAQIGILKYAHWDENTA